MTQHIRAHFDGRVLVPDGPVDLPVNQPLDIEVTPTSSVPVNGHGAGDPAVVQERRRRLQASAGVFSGPVLPDEALRRENLYDDRA